MFALMIFIEFFEVFSISGEYQHLVPRITCPSITWMLASNPVRQQILEILCNLYI